VFENVTHCHTTDLGHYLEEGLFINRTVVLEPATLMPTFRIVVSPMYYTAFAIPFVFAIKLNDIAYA
jgi:hypothetical protein